MGKWLWRFGLAAVILCCLGLAMPTQVIGQSQKVLTKISGNELNIILNELGFTPEVSTDREGDPLLRISLGGRLATFKGIFVFYKKVGESHYKDIQLHSAFKRPSRMTEDQLLKKINEFNRRKRLIRAFVDRDGDAVVESDMVLEGGVTEKSIKIFLENFESMVFNFLTFMQQQQ